MRELLTSSAVSAGDADDLVRQTYETDGPLVRWNMISTLDGSAVGADDSSNSINNPADFRVFGFLRAWADAVVVGAGTARAEGYGPLRPNRWKTMREGRSPAPLLVVVSRQDHLPPLLAGAGKDEVLLLGGADASPQDVVDRLRSMNCSRILFEGGPSLASRFVQAGVIDELCLSIAPLVVGGEGTRITAGPDVRADARLLSVLEEEGTILTRWAL